MNHYEDYFYIASCIFTRGEPLLSEHIQQYISSRFNMPIIRCCVANYKTDELANMIAEKHRGNWERLPDYVEFPSGSTMVYICHNCLSIFQEQKPDILTKSIWELILEDEGFIYPNYNGEKITIQDCWRSYDNLTEQNAVRELMKRMNLDIVELEENHEKTDFCGISLLQPSPSRNLKLAPKRYVENAKGKFIAHSDEEKRQIMEEHCKKIKTDRVAAYCHYCIDGLGIGGKNAVHIASLLFPEK